MIIGLLVGVWVARYLGPTEFGKFSYATAYVSFFTALASLGLDSIIIRDIIKEPQQSHNLLGVAFILKFIGGIISFAFVCISIFIITSDWNIRYLVLIISLGLFFQAIDIIDIWFQSQVLSKYSVIAKITAFLLSTITKIVLIFLRAPLTAFAWVAFMEIALGALGLVVIFKLKSYIIIHFANFTKLAFRLISDSWPLIFSSIVVIIYMRIDQIMLGHMAGIGEVGIYSVAVSLAEAWYFIPIAVVSSTFPSIMVAKMNNEELFYSRLQKLYNLMVFIAYLVAVPVTFLAEPVITYFYGPNYSKAGAMLSILIWAGIFTNLGVARSSFLTSMNWSRIHLITVLMGCILNVLLNIVLIPVYQGMGAVIATCISYWFAAHGSCFFYRPLFRTGTMLTKALFYPKFW